MPRIRTTLASNNGTYAPLPAAARNPLTGWYHADGYGAKIDGTTDDTAAIQAALTAAASAGGRVYIPFIGAAVTLVSAPLVISSNTELVVHPAVTVRLKAGSNCNLLNNATVAAARTVSDAATTIGSAVVTTTLTASVGQTVTVAGAGFGGSNLYGTVTATGSGTLTLNATATATLTGASASAYNRNSNIRISGGIWDAGNNAGSAVALHALRLRRCDNLVVSDLTVMQTAGKYAVNLGDCTQFTVRDLVFGTVSDGVHINGPASSGTVRNLKGTTGDDLAAITCVDFAAYNDCSGNVTDVTISDLHGVNCTFALVKLVAGPNTSLKQIKVSDVGGTCGTVPIIIGDATIGAGAEVSGISVNRCDAGGSGSGAVNVQTETNVVDLAVRDLVWQGAAGTTVQLVKVGSGATVKTLTVDGLRCLNAGTNVTGVQIDGTCNDLFVANADLALSGTTNGGTVVVQGALARASLTNVDQQAGRYIYLHASSASVATELHLSNYNAVGTDSVVQVQGSPLLQIFLGPGTANPASGVVKLANSGTARVLGHGPRLVSGSGLSVLNSNVVSVQALTFSCDVSLLAKTANDMAFNSNGALGCGVGPVICNGTSWKHLYTGATY